MEKRKVYIKHRWTKSSNKPKQSVKLMVKSKELLIIYFDVHLGYYITRENIPNKMEAMKKWQLGNKILDDLIIIKPVL